MSALTRVLQRRRNRAPVIDVPTNHSTEDLDGQHAAPGDVHLITPSPESPSIVESEQSTADPSTQETVAPPHDSCIDVDTLAPRIGTVLDAPAPTMKAGVRHRSVSIVADGVTVGGYHVAAASHVGLAHTSIGEPRQDSYNFALTTSGRLVVAVADGLGSRPDSQIGARQFCDDVVFAATSKPDGSAADYLQMAAERTASIARAAYRLEPAAVSFVGAVAVIDSTGLDVVRVGDVSAFVIDPDGTLRELFPVDDAHINIVGAALPDSEAELEWQQMTTLPPRIVIATDGVANDLRRSSAVRRWLGGTWAGRPTAHAMSDSLRYRRRGSHDDRTAVVVAVPPAHPPLVANPPDLA